MSMSEPEITKRGPGRPSLRKDEGVRSAVSDSVARAAARIEELRANTRVQEDRANEFDIPMDWVPEGWSYEWKRTHTTGKEDVDNMMTVHEAGWSPVPVDRHPELMPVGYKGANIAKKGLMLMERPLLLTEAANQRTQREYAKVLADKRESLGETPAGTMPRDADNRVRPKVDMKYEQVDIPSD
jgi:hypothetical protein